MKNFEEIKKELLNMEGTLLNLDNTIESITNSSTSLFNYTEEIKENEDFDIAYNIEEVDKGIIVYFKILNWDADLEEVTAKIVDVDKF